MALPPVLTPGNRHQVLGVRVRGHLSQLDPRTGRPGSEPPMGDRETQREREGDTHRGRQRRRPCQPACTPAGWGPQGTPAPLRPPPAPLLPVTEEGGGGAASLREVPPPQASCAVFSTGFLQSGWEVGGGALPMGLCSPLQLPTGASPGTAGHAPFPWSFRDWAAMVRTGSWDGDRSPAATRPTLPVPIYARHPCAHHPCAHLFPPTVSCLHPAQTLWFLSSFSELGPFG